MSDSDKKLEIPELEILEAELNEESLKELFSK